MKTWGGDDPVTREPLSGEAAAVATFNEFMDTFLKAQAEQNGTRTAASRPRVSGVHSTNTVVYGEPLSATRSTDNGIPVYELTLQNDDSTEGFAVVVGEESLQEVIAYVPKGAISDTTFNAGLAFWFREMYALGRETQSGAETRSIYQFQDGYAAANNTYWTKVADTDTYLREMTADERLQWWNQYSYGSTMLSKMVVPRIKSTWSQETPYNNRVPEMYRNSSGVMVKCRIGCGPVAIGQVIASYKYRNSSNYDWTLLTTNPTIAANTSAATEVANFLWDVSEVSETVRLRHPNGDYMGSASTYNHDIGPTLEQFGYRAMEFDYTSNILDGRIETNIEWSSTSVLVRGADVNDVNNPVGHLWIVDGVLRLMRFKDYPVTSPSYQIWRCRELLTMYYCNWGWGGLSDGWYYNYNPKQAPAYTGTGEYHYYLNLDKLYWLVEPL